MYSDPDHQAFKPFSIFCYYSGAFTVETKNGWKVDVLNCSDSDKSYTQTRLLAYETAAVLPGHPSYLGSCLFSSSVPRLLAILSSPRPSNPINSFSYFLFFWLKQQELPHSSGTWNSRSRPRRAGVWWEPLPGLQAATSLLCPRMEDWALLSLPS